MITEMLRYRSYMKKLLFITAVMLLVMIAMIAVTKRNIKTDSIETFHTGLADTELLTKPELNVPETKVLLSISDWADATGTSSDQRGTYQIIYHCLREHYESPGVDISADSAVVILEMVSSRNEIVNMERETQLNRMSFDAREMVMHLLKKICEVSGLKLMMNESGDIEKITDTAGHIIYQKENLDSETGFQLGTVFIILTLLVFLFVICIFISKKSQIMVVKGRGYHGIDEEEYA